MDIVDFGFKEHRFSNLSNDKKVLIILSNFKSLPLTALVSLTGLSKGHLYRILESLQKYDEIKKITVCKASFYSLKKQKQEAIV